MTHDEHEMRTATGILTWAMVGLLIWAIVAALMIAGAK